MPVDGKIVADPGLQKWTLESGLVDCRGIRGRYKHAPCYSMVGYPPASGISTLPGATQRQGEAVEG